MVKTASTQAFPCPSKCGCGRVFKGLKTLSNHFDLCHPREDKPDWIFNNWARSLGKSKSKTAGHPSGLTFQDFVKAKCAEFRSTGSTIPQRERIRIISQMWQDAKDPLPEGGQRTPKGGQKRSPPLDPCPSVGSTDSDGLSEPPSPVFQSIHINEAADADIDLELVECCKTLHQGGFIRAFRKLNPIVEPHSVIADLMENTWMELCDTWCDFQRSELFDGSHFDDTLDWEDVKDTLVDGETLVTFFL